MAGSTGRRKCSVWEDYELQETYCSTKENLH